MNFFKILIILIFLLFSTSIYADNHGESSKKSRVVKV